MSQLPRPEVGRIIKPAPEFSEIGTVYDTNQFIASELLPFAQRIFGMEKIPRGGNVALTADFGNVEGPRVRADLAISQLGGLGVRGLQYEFQIAERNHVKNQTADEWKALKRAINNVRGHNGEDLLPKGKLSSFSHVVEYHAVSYTLQHGTQARVELWGGYEVDVAGEGEEPTVFYSSGTDWAAELEDETEREEVLSVINAQCHRELASTDVDAMYRVLTRFGHVPDDAKRAKKAISGTNSVPGRQVLPLIYDFS